MVKLYLEIDTAGRPVNVRVLRSLGMGFDETAIEAVKKWKFRPALKEGQPVTASVNVAVDFRFEH
jgi:protein TonB